MAEFAGKTAVIQIVDEATGGWGHINVDHIVQTDRKPPGLLSNAKREFTVETRYLNLPIKNGAPKRVVTLLVDGKPVVRNDIELADGTPDWWAPMDVSAWQGKTVTLRRGQAAGGLDGAHVASNRATPSRARRTSTANRCAASSTSRPGAAGTTTRTAWCSSTASITSSSSTIRTAGTGATCTGATPSAATWSTGRNWATSCCPTRWGRCSAAARWWTGTTPAASGKTAKPPLVLVYTAAGNPTVQCIAYSTDGRTFTKYAGNPVVKQITGGNRDPKVHLARADEEVGDGAVRRTQETAHDPLLHLAEPEGVDAGQRAGRRHDGKDGYLFECPDFFELPVDGDAKSSKWVLLGANSEYAIGTFDGTTFTPEQTRLPGHRGNGFYAAQTFSDMPGTTAAASRSAGSRRPRRACRSTSR